MTNGKAVLSQLRKELTWLNGWKMSHWGRDSVDNRAANLIAACLYLLAQVPTTDLRAWIARKPHRTNLKSYRRAIRRGMGRKAIQELITVTISAVEAFSPRKTWHTGPLDCSAPPRTEAQLEAARKGLRAMNDNQGAPLMVAP